MSKPNVIKTTCKQLFSVKYSEFPRSGGLVTKGKYMYLTKTNNADNKTIVVRRKADGSGSNSVFVKAMDMGHGNGITTNGTSLFIAAGGGQSKQNKLVKVTSSGKCITYTGPFMFQTIAYAGSNDFIVKNSADTSAPYIRFRHIGLNNADRTYYERQDRYSFYLYNHRAESLVEEKNYKVMQDFAYDRSTKRLYLLQYNGTTRNENIILAYDLSSRPDKRDNIDLYRPVDMYVVKNKDLEQFEVESIALKPKKSGVAFYLFMNSKTRTGSRLVDTDAVYSIIPK